MVGDDAGDRRFPAGAAAIGGTVRRTGFRMAIYPSRVATSAHWRLAFRRIQSARVAAGAFPIGGYSGWPAGRCRKNRQQQGNWPVAERSARRHEATAARSPDGIRARRPTAGQPMRPCHPAILHDRASATFEGWFALTGHRRKPSVSREASILPPRLEKAMSSSVNVLTRCRAVEMRISACAVSDFPTLGQILGSCKRLPAPADRFRYC